MRTFKSEDQRKDKLFTAWIRHLQATCHVFFTSQFIPRKAKRTYEGMATVLNVGTDYLSLELETKVKIKRLVVSPDVCEFQRKGDLVYVVLAMLDHQWLPVDVISIGSMVPTKNEQQGFHLTYNPMLVPPQANPFTSKPNQFIQ